VRVRLSFALIAAALWAAPSALANSSTSSNWAGYAIHHSHVTFNKVIGAWQQPKLTCRPGVSTYSAYWIGLGGYDIDSNALEQIGTEADCGISGDARMSAWYELVPAPSRSLKLTVHAGDILAASVSVTGHRVRLELADATTHKTAVKTLTASALDLTSAEWIAEAPSECVSSQSCQTLPLADFGSTNFSFAYAQTSTGHRGAITNRSWTSTKITLVASGRRFAGLGGGGVGEATPSKLTNSGSAFSIAYSAASGEPGSGPPLVASDLRSAGLVR
jgi:Peptidase A4 family